MSDRYTQLLLTIIATCLVYQVSKDILSTANAQATMNVNIVAVGYRYIVGGPLPVQVVP